MMMKALIKVALTHLHETSSHASQLMNIRDDPSTASFAAVLLSLYWLITQQPRNQRLEQRICAGSIWHKHFKVKGGLGDRIRSDYHQCVCVSARAQIHHLRAESFAIKAMSPFSLKRRRWEMPVVIRENLLYQTLSYPIPGTVIDCHVQKSI